MMYHSPTWNLSVCAPLGYIPVTWVPDPAALPRGRVILRSGLLTAEVFFGEVVRDMIDV